jgi:flagellin
MILDNTQDLIIYANGSSATVTVEGEDTIQDFVNKFNNAAATLGLGTAVMKYNAAAGSGDDAVAGTLVFASTSLVGDQSEIRLVGDESLINALSIVTLHDAENTTLGVTISDAHGGATFAEDTVSDYMVRGLIKGIDVKVDAGITAGNVFLHVVDHSTKVQVGANEGQTFDVSIGQVNTTSLEIDDAYVVTMADSQKAITKFDQALEKVNSARATIGAQVNRLEYTMKNLSISRENLIAAESRIRDLDVAEESSTFAKNQILVNSAVAMLAQANTLPQIALQLLR